MIAFECWRFWQWRSLTYILTTYWGWLANIIRYKIRYMLVNTKIPNSMMLATRLRPSSTFWKKILSKLVSSLYCFQTTVVFPYFNLFLKRWQLIYWVRRIHCFVVLSCVQYTNTYIDITRYSNTKDKWN